MPCHSFHNVFFIKMTFITCSMTQNLKNSIRLPDIDLHIYPILKGYM